MQQPFQRKAPKLVLSFKAKKLPWQLFLVKGGIVFFNKKLYCGDIPHHKVLKVGKAVRLNKICMHIINFWTRSDRYRYT